MPEDLTAPSAFSASIENSRIAAPFQSVARTKVPPDMLSIPRAIPFGLTAAEFAFCLDPRGFPIVLRVPPDLAQFRGARLREPIVLPGPEAVKCPGRGCKSPKNSLVRTTVGSCRHHYCKSCGYTAIWKLANPSPTQTHMFAVAQQFPSVLWDETICDLDAREEFNLRAEKFLTPDKLHPLITYNEQVGRHFEQTPALGVPMKSPLVYDELLWRVFGTWADGPQEASMPSYGRSSLPDAEFKNEDTPDYVAPKKCAFKCLECGTWIKKRGYCERPQCIDVRQVPSGEGDEETNYWFFHDTEAAKHGLAGWIHGQKKIGAEAFHSQEIREKEKTHCLGRKCSKSGFNTGAGPVLASHINSLETVRVTTATPIDAVYPFWFREPSMFGVKALAVAKGFSDNRSSGEEEGAPSKEDLEEKINKTENVVLEGLDEPTAALCDNLDSPVSAYDPDQNDDPADLIQEEFADFIEGTNSIDQIVKENSAEQLAEEAVEWAQRRASYDKLLQDGAAWLPTDPQNKNTMINGVKVNLENEITRLILFDIDLHDENFESDSPMKELAERYSFQQFDALGNRIGGIDEKTLRTKLEKTRNYGMKQEMLTTKFTAEQVADIEAHDGRVVYAHLIVGKARWYKLDLDTFDTYEDALADVRTKIVEEAWRKEYPHRRIDTATKAQLLEARKEIVSRIHPAFRKANVYIADWRRRPMTVAIAEESWEKAAF